MPTGKQIAIAPVLLVTILAAPKPADAQSGGDYDLTQYTIDSGPGTLAGGEYTLTGSVGQPRAGPTASGGEYTLTGGLLQPTNAPPPGWASGPCTESDRR